ncbi:hypothetical protein CTEN210_04653 [Chaetoceros tenuissimus]|uniref:Uncharacterized protein n=1 Tax=Chaetoceros tenuissimus TaxID=426638 RepID=A0AAD3CLB4_9STRA|nr:hypothetical protein CTEN210_04653 [Chaetoceros tenuissimus]
MSDEKAAKEWKTNLNATLNRLSNQYLTLLRAASSEVALEEAQVDQRAGGGQMKSQNEPPPPLAASAELSELSTAVATENICTSVNTLLDLIRTLRLSVTIMGEERFREEEVECWEDGVVIDEICEETMQLEREIRSIMNK